jgi:signal transduction histidine kinase
MSVDLAHWLRKYKEDLLEQWVAALPTPAVSSQNGSMYAATYTAPDPSHTALAEIPHVLIDELIVAADGQSAALDQLVNRLGQETWQQLALPDLMQTLYSFRRVAWALMRASAGADPALFDLLDQVDHLVEQMVDALARSWVTHSAELLHEREFIAESLDAAAAEADRRALQLKALNEISQRLSASLENDDQLLELVGSSLKSLLGVAHIAIWLLDSDAPAGSEAGGLRAIYTWGEEQVPVEGMLLTAETAHDPIWQAYSGGRMLFQPRPEAQADLCDWLQPGCGVIVFPIVVKDAAIGALALQDPDPVGSLRFQQDLAEGVVNQTAIALQNARLYAQVRELNTALEQRVAERTRELQYERDRLETLNEISTEVGRSLELDQLLPTSLELLAGIIQAEHGSIMLLDPSSDLLMSRAVLGKVTNDSFTRFPVGVGIAGWVAQMKKPALVSDVSNDERWVALPESSGGKRSGAMIAVPLVVQGEVIGVMTLSHTQRGFFNEDHLRLLVAAAGSIAIGINNANFYSEIVSQYEHSSELRRRLQTEASQTAAILQSLADGVIVCDLYGAVLSANPSASQLLHRSSEELVLSNLHELIERYLGARADEMPLRELLARPLAHNGQLRMFDCMLWIGQYYVRMTLGPVLKEDGELIGALLVLRDITLESESDRLKTEFIGTMSHELRTPMTAIKGFTQLLAMGGLGPLNDTQREFVDTIYNNTERMIALINDVLDITKIESGSVELELRPLHLAETLSGVVAELREEIDGRTHDLNIGIPPGLPLVRADANRLQQVLHNLLLNAIKYTPNGGKIVVEAYEARLEELPEALRDTVVADRRYTQLNIRDNGVGIAENELDKIFKRFYRTENPLKIEAGGTGLGLSLVKPMIELLGGKIWVESVLNEGSTFSIILPAA